MLGSKSFKNQGRSTGVSLKSSSSSVSGKKDNFFTFLYKRIYALLMKLWGKTRSMLWIGSTGRIKINVGFILLIIPFSFLYLTEMEKHSMKMMEGKNKNNFRSRNALIHIHNSYSISYYDSIFTFCIFLHEIEIKPSAIKNLLYHTLIYRFKGINHMKIYLPLPFNFIKNDGDLLENGLNGFAGRKNDSAKTTFMKFLQEDSRISSIIKF